MSSDLLRFRFFPDLMTGATATTTTTAATTTTATPRFPIFITGDFFLSLENDRLILTFLCFETFDRLWKDFEVNRLTVSLQLLMAKYILQEPSALTLTSLDSTKLVRLEAKDTKKQFNIKIQMT